MHFIPKFTTLLLAIAASMVNVEAAPTQTSMIVARNESASAIVVTCEFIQQSDSSLVGSCNVNQLAELSVIFWDDVGFQGASFSPDIVQGVCSTLPGNWLDRAESVQIAEGFGCTFYTLAGCEGTGTALSGNVTSLPDPPLYNAVESLFCTKQA